ncbi:MFS transporter [Acinetobacter rudis]|uniref:MFS transporter n=1 Tax=Acinetobacter rudis TaxID=632955 RepID=A0AAW8J2A4_9GAMM|nr:MFS transporter [Acinetobacter rudis]MDQ8934137.1 MFS transporter [Acinetobacter rudis]MDQ8954409.1 MFS transporter [Acinetobacter rudis]MDQ9016555.1 MFS transporter [Acinetobacter rudis]
MNTTAPSTPSDKITDRNLAPQSEQGSWLALITISITAFILVCCEFLPIGVLNQIATELNISTGQAGLAITLPGVMGAISAPLLPILIKKLDRRIFLMALTTIMLIANLITVFSNSYEVLMFSRFMLGISIGGFWATAIALSGRLAPPHLDIAKATAIIIAGVTFATVFGVPIGTWMGELWGWRSGFALSLFMAIPLLALQYYSLPQLKPQSAIKFRDLPELFKDPKARQGLSIIFLIGLAHFSAFSYLGAFFKQVAGFNAAAISSLFLTYGIASIFGNAFAGFSAAINVRYTFVILAACFATVFYSFPIHAINLSNAFVLTALWGFAFGAFPTTANIWMFTHAAQAVEKGMPLYIGIFQTMIATGSLLGGLIVDHFSINVLLLSVLTLIALALVSIFTWSRGLNNPKTCCTIQK